MIGVAAAGFLLALPACDSRKSTDVTDHRDKDTSSSSSMTRPRAGTREEAGPPAQEIKDWEKFREQVATLSKDDLKMLYPQLRQSVKNDPQGTLEAIDQLSPGLRRTSLLREVFVSYPKDRHSELVIWADQSPLSEDIHQIYMIVVPGKNPTLDPAQVLALYSEVSRGDAKGLLANYSAWQSAEGGANSLAQCKATMDQLSPRDQKNFVYSFARAALAKDPVAAGTMIMADPDGFGSDSLYSMGHSLGTGNPLATQQSIVEFTERAGDPEAFQAFVKGWFSADSIQASEWAATLPEPLRNEAYLQLAKELKQKGATEEAREFLKGITDEAVKKRYGYAN